MSPHLRNIICSRFQMTSLSSLSSTPQISLFRVRGKHREFKRNFNQSDFSDYTKTLASFANAGGGVLIFGVEDKPRRITGIDEIVDEAKWADRLREDFAPEIEIATKVYDVRDLRFFAIVWIIPPIGRSCAGKLVLNRSWTKLESRKMSKYCARGQSITATRVNWADWIC